MSRRRRRSVSGRSSGGDIPASETDWSQPGCLDSTERGLLEALRGPDACRFVALDKSGGGNNSAVTIALLQDSAELMSVRLAVGGDAAEALQFPDIDRRGGYLPHQCIVNKAPRCLEACLAAGPNANAQDPDGNTTLHYAARCMLEEHRGDFLQRRYSGPSGNERELADLEAMLMTLKSHGADISLTDLDGNCAIATAIQIDQLTTAAMLIKVFASDPGSQHSKIRFAAILRAVMAEEIATGTARAGSAAFQVALQKKLALANFLETLDLAWHPGGWGDGSGKPGGHEPLQVAALAEAALKRSAAMTLRWLCSSADAEAVRLGIRGQRAPLVHVALQADVPRMVYALEVAGVDLSLPDERGLTVLHSALQLRRKDFTQQLLERAPQKQLGRLLTCDDGEGLTALGFCVARDRAQELPLVLRACERARLGVSGLLERHAARTVHQWPVFAAVVEGRLSVLEQLLAAGLDPESAACRQHVDTSEETDTANLAQPSERTETVTLLMCAASIGNLPAVKLLLAAGADARCSPAGNRFLLDAVTMVLGGLQLKAPLKLARPDFEISALAEPWLRHWEQDAGGPLRSAAAGHTRAAGGAD